MVLLSLQLPLAEKDRLDEMDKLGLPLGDTEIVGLTLRDMVEESDKVELELEVADVVMLTLGESDKVRLKLEVTDKVGLTLELGHFPVAWLHMAPE